MPFERIVHQHHAAVLRAARRVLADDGAAADVAQDVFVQVLRGKLRLPAVRDERAVLCWLATRLARNAVRATVRRQHHEELAMNVTPVPAPDLLTAAAAAERHRALAAGLASLPRELRLVVCLRCEDGLPFAAIGTALAIPESTAHERFARGIARLRQQLAAGGFAWSVVDVVRGIGDLVPPRVPALESRLLRFGRGGLLAATTAVRHVAWLCAATLALVATAFAGAIAADGPLPPPSATPAVALPAPMSMPAVAMGVRSVVPQDPPAVPPPPPPVPPPAVAPALSGTVHDADGAPVVGVRVEARASGGLKPFALGATTTGDGGAFVLRLEPGRLGGLVHKLRLEVVAGDSVLLVGGDIEVPRPDALCTPLALVLPPLAGTQATRYRLQVAVRDANGLAVDGAAVWIHAGPAAPPRPGHGSREAQGKTTASGSAELSGRAFGDKWLFVDGRPVGQPAVLMPFSVDAAKVYEQVVVLPAPNRVVVDVAAVDGGDVDRVSLWLEDAVGLQYTPAVGADGKFVFSAVAAGPHTVHAMGWPWSTIRRALAVPAPDVVRIGLKRFDDARARGDHMAELHGRLIDAKTGAPVPFGGFALATHPLLDGDSSLATDLAPPPAPVQTMSDGTTSEVFHLTGLAAGRHVVVVRVPGYANTVWPVDLQEGEVRPDVAIPLEAAAEIRGRVVDAAGVALAGARVYAIGIGPGADAVLQAAREAPRGRWPRVALCSATTRADGSFVLGGLPPGIALRVAAAAEGEDLAVSPPNLLRAGDRVQDVVLRLPER